MPSEPTTRVRVAHLLTAVVGTLLLAGVCFVTAVEGALGSQLIGDSCSPGDAAACHNADTATTVLLVTPPVVFLVATIGAWQPTRKYTGYVPYGWVAFLGISVVVGSWFVAEWLAPGWFF